MGIKGLYKFLTTNYPECFEWYKLHDCTVVIDGNNLAHHLQEHAPHINRAFGGDFDKYAYEVEVFIKRMKKCGIKPLIINDGGQPPKLKKFRTATDRNRNLIECSFKIHPVTQKDLNAFPPLHLSVFANVIQELGVDVIQSDFEADDDIAVIARKLGAFVISNDSDFFLYDLPFIILDSLNYTQSQKEKTENGIQRFIPCYKFNQKKFTAHSGVHKDLIPAFSLLLGNDHYGTTTVMRSFYQKFDVKITKDQNISYRQHLIKSIAQWLAHQKGNPAAVKKKILKYVHPNTPRRKIDNCMKLMQEYAPKGSTLTSWINSHENYCPLYDKEFKDQVSTASLVPYKSTQYLPKKVTFELNCRCLNRIKSNIVAGNLLPKWFIHAYRHALIYRILGDILNKNYFFTHPLIEVPHFDSSYKELEGVIKAIRAIIFVSIIKSDGAAHKTKEMPKGKIKTSKGSKETALSTEEKRAECSPLVISEKKGDSSPSESDSEEENDMESLNLAFQDMKICFNDQNMLEDTEEDAKNILDDAIFSIPLTKIKDESFIKTYQSEGKDTSHPLTSKTDVLKGNENEKKDQDKESILLLSDSDTDTDEDYGNDTMEIEKNFNYNEEQNCHYTDAMDLKLSEIRKSKEIPTIFWLTRKGKRPWANVIKGENISAYEKYPTLCEMEELSEADRRELFFKLADLFQLAVPNLKFSQELPQDLEFILIIIIFWYSKHTKHVSLHLLLTILMNVVMFMFVDGRYGRVRGISEFRKLRQLAKHVKQNVKPTSKELETLPIKKLIESLSKDECRLAMLNLYQFHFFVPKIRSKFNRYAMHAFSEYQASIYFLSILNSVLFYPFPMVNVRSFFSGTFAYNIFKCFSSKVSPNLVLKCLLGDNLRFLRLFSELYSQLKIHLDIPPLNEVLPKVKKGVVMSKISKKVGYKKPSQLNIDTLSAKERENLPKRSTVRRKKVTPKGKKVIKHQEYETLEDPTEEDLLALAGNKFSLLLTSQLLDVIE